MPSRQHSLSSEDLRLKAAADRNRVDAWSRKYKSGFSVTWPGSCHRRRGRRASPSRYAYGLLDRYVGGHKFRLALGVDAVEIGESHRRRTAGDRLAMAMGSLLPPDVEQRL